MIQCLISRYRQRANIVVLSIAPLVAIAELVSTVNTRAQTTTYAVTLVNAVPDGGQVPGRLNSLGDLVGRINNSAVLWSHASYQAQRLGVLPGGEYSFASAINDASEVVGSSN